MGNEIEESLGLTPLEETDYDYEEEKTYDLITIEEGETDEDFARRDLMEIMKLTQDSAKSAAHLAKSSEHPRAYEVLSQLINSALAANKAFVEMTEAKKAKTDSDDEDHRGNTTNNIIMADSDSLMAIAESVRNKMKNGTQE